MDKELKKSIIKKSLGSPEGWQNLASAIKEAPNPEVAKQEVEEFLRELGGDKTVDLPVQNGTENDSKESKGETVETVQVPIAELLVQQLNQHLSS